MKLVTLALQANAADDAERAIRHTEAVKARADRVRTLVERAFGVPFHEAFDVSKVEITNEGDTLEVDRYIYLHDDGPDSLGVSVYRPHTDEFVGWDTFHDLDEAHHQENLINLGYLLSRAHTVNA